MTDAPGQGDKDPVSQFGDPDLMHTYAERGLRPAAPGDRDKPRRRTLKPAGPAPQDYAYPPREHEVEEKNAENAQLKKRVAELEKRVAELERRLGVPERPHPPIRPHGDMGP